MLQPHLVLFLVGNRGEIAVRIIKAAKESGLKSIAVYSEPDKKILCM